MRDRDDRLEDDSSNIGRGIVYGILLGFLLWGIIIGIVWYLFSK